MASTHQLLHLTQQGFQKIGYQAELLINDYAFADFMSSDYAVRNIPLAGFAQYPPSYKSVGFGVLVANEGNPQVRDFTALGAPHIFVIHSNEDVIRRWKIIAAKPELLDVIQVQEFADIIQKNSDTWGPDSILRAKSIGNYNQLQQLDFFDLGLLPVLEREVHLKLDRLFDRTVTVAVNAHQELHNRSLNSDEYRSLFRLIFRLVAAKLLSDRQYQGDWLNSDVSLALRNVNEFYFKEESPDEINLGHRVQQLVWDEIRAGFHLQNLSLEALAYVYENTFVSSETRRLFDTHATPPEVADFVLKQLPLEEIPNPKERIIFEPFAGHAPFLTASLVRLRSLLPADMSVSDRHDYFVDMLYGIELDSFAREVARHSLILADYPNPDGWQIEEANVFSSPVFEEYLKKANVVLCNPPYGQFSAREREQYPNLRAPNKAVDAILRVLEHPPKMLGFVLPRSFTDGRSYKLVRQKLAELYRNITILALPDIAFHHSEAETVVLIASNGARDKPRQWQRIFVSKEDYPNFWYTGQPTWQDTAVIDREIEDDLLLWRHPLIVKLREHLQGFQILKDVAAIHRGIEYKGTASNHISDNFKDGYAEGLQNIQDGLQPYQIVGHKYLDLDSSVMRRNAHLYPWDQPKILLNVAGISRGPWRLMAAIDNSGLVCYKRFYGIWAIDSFSLEIIAAVLNGPVANVLLNLSEKARDNRIKDLYSIPLPKLTQEDIDYLVEVVRECIAMMAAQKPVPEIEAKIAQINVAVLSGYNLPYSLECELLDYIGHLAHPYMELSFVDQVGIRHGLLVDKKFLEGLTVREESELDQLNRILDAAEEKYFAPIKNALSNIKATLLDKA